jgi:O-antigen ligase
MFCSFAFTAALIAARGPRAAVLALLSMLATFSSLSSGAYTAVATQVFLLSWDRALRAVRRRWLILAGLGAAAYVVVDLLSNRSPIAVFISYATFQPHTAYHRILIWEYGSAVVWANPLFGIGFNDWARASWMSSSVDNFWLLMAMRHGLPGFAFIALAVLLTIAAVARSHGGAAEGDDRTRVKYAVMMVSICIAICTVHLWGATFALFMFLIGAGACLAERSPQPRQPR